MSTKHTPGPWFVAGAGGFRVASITQSVGVYADQLPEAQHIDADARLIAAAPELLEALQELFGADMEHVLMGDGKDDQIEAIAKAKAAIAKATGEQQ